MKVIVRICRKLNCGIEDIMEVLPETRERSRGAFDRQYISIYHIFNKEEPEFQNK